MVQQVIFYYQDNCSSSWLHQPPQLVENLYNPFLYKNDDSFNLEPEETVLVILNNCSESKWFPQAIHGECIYHEESDTYVMIPLLQQQHLQLQDYRMCLLITNTSTQMIPRKNLTFLVSEKTPLATLLSQPEIKFKLGFVAVDKFKFPPPSNHSVYYHPEAYDPLAPGSTTVEFAKEAEAYDNYSYQDLPVVDEEEEDSNIPIMRVL